MPTANRQAHAPAAQAQMCTTRFRAHPAGNKSRRSRRSRARRRDRRNSHGSAGRDRGIGIGRPRLRRRLRCSRKQRSRQSGSSRSSCNARILGNPMKNSTGTKADIQTLLMETMNGSLIDDCGNHQQGCKEGPGGQDPLADRGEDRRLHPEHSRQNEDQREGEAGEAEGSLLVLSEDMAVDHIKARGRQQEVDDGQPTRR